jgi:hypothetical protein
MDKFRLMLTPEGKRDIWRPRRRYQDGLDRVQQPAVVNAVMHVEIS